MRSDYKIHFEIHQNSMSCCNEENMEVYGKTRSVGGFGDAHIGLFSYWSVNHVCLVLL